MKSTSSIIEIENDGSKASSSGKRREHCSLASLAEQRATPAIICQTPTGTMTRKVRFDLRNSLVIQTVEESDDDGFSWGAPLRPLDPNSGSDADSNDRMDEDFAGGSEHHVIDVSDGYIMNIKMILWMTCSPGPTLQTPSLSPSPTTGLLGECPQPLILKATEWKPMVQVNQNIIDHSASI